MQLFWAKKSARSQRNSLTLLAGALALVAQGAQAATYYVSPSGGDSNPGTQAAPFRHISKAASAATQAGDTVIVMDGTYDNEGKVGPAYVVTLYYSGTSGNPITFQAQHRGMAVLDSMNTSTTTSCNGASAYFNLYHASFIVIQGFVIQRGCDEGIHSNDTAHDITIKQNEIRNIANHTVTDQIGRDGIYLNTSEYNFTFDSNSFHDIGRTDGVTTLHFDHGIYSHAANLTIINNVFYNMKRGWSIQMADGANNYLIANNTFAFPNANGSDGQIMWWGANTNITLRNNIFYQPQNYAMTQYAASISGCVFDHNLIYPASGAMGSMAGCNVGTNLTGSNPNPKFVNASSTPYNFAVQQGGAGVDAGINVSSVSYDYVGTSRPQGSSTDIGAYEYAAGGTTGTGGSGGSTGSGGTGSGGGTTADITTGLAAQWKFTDGSGALASDSSGKGNTATLFNPTWWTSNYGMTCWFSGSSSYGMVKESPSLEMTSQLTVAFWLRPSQNSNTDPRVISKLYDWDVKLNGSSRYPQFSAGGQYAVLNYALPLITWHHVVFTFSNGAVNGYVDGVQVPFSANTFTATSLPNLAYGLYLATYDSSLSNPYIGSLDDVRLYSRALSAADVATLYTALPRLN
jgi:hypothetical protein